MDIPIDGTTLVNVLLGPVTSWLISAIVSPLATPRFKAVLTLIVCFAMQAFVTFIGKSFVGDWGPDTWENIRLVAVNFAAIFVSAFVAYQAFNKPVGIAAKLEANGVARFGE